MCENAFSEATLPYHGRVAEVRADIILWTSCPVIETGGEKMASWRQERFGFHVHSWTCFRKMAAVPKTQPSSDDERRDALRRYERQRDEQLMAAIQLKGGQGDGSFVRLNKVPMLRVHLRDADAHASASPDVYGDGEYSDSWLAVVVQSCATGRKYLAADLGGQRCIIDKETVESCVQDLQHALDALREADAGVSY